MESGGSVTDTSASEGSLGLSHSSSSRSINPSWSLSRPSLHSAVDGVLVWAGGGVDAPDSVGVAVAVAVAVAVFVAVSPGVGEWVDVEVTVGVGEIVGVLVGSMVPVGVIVTVGVRVGVGV